MRVVLNGKTISVGYVQVTISEDKVAREFTIEQSENTPAMKKGDKVEIYNNKNVLLIEGVVEYDEVGEERKHKYAGRNKARYLVDCYADKTTQFTEKRTMQSVLADVAGKFGIKVVGEAKMPKEDKPTLSIGDKVGETMVKFAKGNGQVITSDAVGNVIIESKPEKRDFVFEYGKNVRSHSFKYNGTVEYDRYVVVAQSNYEKSGKQNVEVRGEYGKGDFVKVIKATENLTKDECNKRAKKEYEKDRRAAIDYSVKMDADIDVDVNKKYKVIDKVAGIDGEMVVKEIVATMDLGTDEIEVKLEYRDDE